MVICGRSPRPSRAEPGTLFFRGSTLALEEGFWTDCSNATPISCAKSFFENRREACAAIRSVTR
jgi:hypothetical protein